MHSSIDILCQRLAWSSSVQFSISPCTSASYRKVLGTLVLHSLSKDLMYTHHNTYTKNWYNPEANDKHIFKIQKRRTSIAQRYMLCVHWQSNSAELHVCSLAELVCVPSKQPLSLAWRSLKLPEYRVGQPKNP